MTKSEFYDQVENWHREPKLEFDPNLPRGYYYRPCNAAKDSRVGVWFHEALEEDETFEIFKDLDALLAAVRRVA
jgi:hypothetical protein